MKIESIKFISGANVYSHRPVLLMRLDLEELKNKRSVEVPNFNRRLIEFLPRLDEHTCNRGCIGGFVESLNEGFF